MSASEEELEPVRIHHMPRGFRKLLDRVGVSVDTSDFDSE